MDISYFEMLLPGTHIIKRLMMLAYYRRLGCGNFVLYSVKNLRPVADDLFKRCNNVADTPSLILFCTNLALMLFAFAGRT